MKTCFTLVIALSMATLCFAGLARADESAKVKARQHFRQGVEYFDQQRFGDALSEFQQSYSLFPVYSTLYNVGQVQVALGHPVQAVDAFDKFLVQGGASIPQEQRARVEGELKAQQERVGDIKIAVSPDGAEIQVDGDTLGKAPLSSAVRVPAGHHRIDARLDGYRSERSEVDVPGRGHVELMIQLQALPQIAPAPLAPPAPVKSTPVATIASPARPAATSRPAERNAIMPQTWPREPSNEESSSIGGVQRALGYTIAGTGLVGAGVGIAYAVDGQSKHDDALAQYAANDKSTAQQTESTSSKEKTKGYLIIGAGGAVMLTGAILLVSAPTSHAGHARMNVSPWVGTSVAGASVGGVW